MEHAQIIEAMRRRRKTAEARYADAWHQVGSLKKVMLLLGETSAPRAEVQLLKGLKAYAEVAIAGSRYGVNV